MNWHEELELAITELSQSLEISRPHFIAFLEEGLACAYKRRFLMDVKVRYISDERRLKIISEQRTNYGTVIGSELPLDLHVESELHKMIVAALNVIREVIPEIELGDKVVIAAARACIPAIANGEVIIKRFAREPWTITRIAVQSSQPGISAVSRCRDQGRMGLRLCNLVEFVEWSEDQPTLLVNSLVGFDVKNLEFSSDGGSATVFLTAADLEKADMRSVELAEAITRKKIILQAVENRERKGSRKGTERAETSTTTRHSQNHSKQLWDKHFASVNAAVARQDYELARKELAELVAVAENLTKEEKATVDPLLAGLKQLIRTAPESRKESAAAETERQKRNEKEIARWELFIKQTAELYQSGENEAAMEQAQRAVAIAQLVFERSDLRLANSLLSLANPQSKLGAHSEAIKNTTEALAIYTTTLGTEDADTNLMKMTLAIMHGTKGAYTRCNDLFSAAKPFVERSRDEGLRKAYAKIKAEFDDLMKVGYVRISSANFVSEALDLQNTGKFEEAEKKFNLALTSMQIAFGDDHEDLELVRQYLVCLLLEMGRTEEARPLANYEAGRGLYLCRQGYALLVKSAATATEDSVERQELLTQAKQRFLEGISVLEVTLGHDHLHLCQPFTQYAELLNLLGQSSEAADYAQRAESIKKRTEL